MALDDGKLNEFISKFVADAGAALHAATVVLGDKLGLYKAMAEGAPVTAEELGERTGTDPRYVREWLSAQAASGYVDYDPVSGTFHLNEVQAFALTNESNPLFVPAAFQIASSTFNDLEKVQQAFRTGNGVGWHEHHTDLFLGTERFFRPSYIANLVSSWIPALEGVQAKLEAGAKIADIGCGHGASTLILAEAFPNSAFHGFDYHQPSIERARRAAEERGISDRVHFEVAPAKSYPGEDYDLVAFFDCLHDMGDPAGASRHVRESLAEDGSWMIVEPYAHDELAGNLNPVGRVYYSASTMVCTPASRSQEVGLALGAQAGEARMRAVVTSGGFRRFRRAAETPFNLVFEARP
jgi:SAM-dependent methyltransferase